MDATTMAVDLAKDVFEVAWANRTGRILERTRLTRRQFERVIDTVRPGTTVLMESVARLTIGAGGVRPEARRYGCCPLSTCVPTCAGTRPTALTRRR
jgi:hypothetical protein